MKEIRGEIFEGVETCNFVRYRTRTLLNFSLVDLYPHPFCSLRFGDLTSLSR
jgi:hypothetical protein